MLAAVVASVWLAAADNAVAPGEFVVEPPTLVNLGFEWKITGDDDRDATVAVEYRKRGDTLWRQGLPLLRIGGEKIWRDKEFFEYHTPHLFAGSILDLQPATTYECRFTMGDPDGVKGGAVAVREATVTTRAEPKASTGGQVRHVYPPGWTGKLQEPSYAGLKAAYYGPGSGDWDVMWMRPVKPGDTILVHAGHYKADFLNYVTEYGIPFHGTYVLTIDGTPDKPIVIKAAGDGEVIFDGNGAYRLFDVSAADHTHFEGLTIKNTEIAFFAGLKDVIGSSGLVVRHCRVEDVGIGLLAQNASSKNFYIADNVFIGRDDQYRLIGWRHSGIYPPTSVKSYVGIKVYGQGHVIAHNYLAYFHDGITVCTHGPPDVAKGEKAAAIDIYNNDIFVMIDDFIEADGGVYNIRVARNRGLNTAEHGLSGQPVFGGPAYYYRNIVYNTLNAIKFGGAHGAGLLFFHNTFIAESGDDSGGSNVQLRNNLILGIGHAKPVLKMLTFTSYSSIDYNGYRPNASGPQFVWQAPRGRSDYSLVREKGFQEAATLAEFGKKTGQERHGVTIDYNVFRNVRPPDPSRPHAIYPVGDLDFQLRPGSAAVDAGVVLPNVNDGFAGKAPDLGAIELGQPVPVYGPRVSK